MATPVAGAGLEAKHYILVAFTAGFIAVAVVTIVFVVLSPAHISFSVTSAGRNDTSDGIVQLDLIIAANNTSRLAAVLYQSIFLYVNNITTGGSQWGANVSSKLPLEQPRRNVTEIHASLPLVGGTLAENFTGNKTSNSFIVSFTAMVRFKIGVAWTKLYIIDLYCVPPVDFFFANKSSSTADCLA